MFFYPHFLNQFDERNYKKKKCFLAAHISRINRQISFICSIKNKGSVLIAYMHCKDHFSLYFLGVGIGWRELEGGGRGGGGRGICHYISNLRNKGLLSMA